MLLALRPKKKKKNRLIFFLLSVEIKDSEEIRRKLSKGEGQNEEGG